MGVSIYLAHLAVQRYDFFDMSAFMDAGWRMAWGQRPYTDFIYNAGPVHPALWAIFFLIFGYGAKAILAYLIATNAVVMICCYMIVRSHLDWLLATICSVTAGVVLFSTTAHPWYDQTADMFSVLALTVVLLSKVETRRQVIRVGLIAGALLACAFMSKANIGLAAGAMIGLMLLGVPWRLIGWAQAACFVGGVAALGLIFLLTRSDPMLFLEQTFFSYGESRFQQLWVVKFVLRYPYYKFTILCVLIAIGLAMFVRGPRRRMLTAAAAGLWGTQVFGWATGSMVPEANYMLLGAVLTPTALLLQRHARPSFWRPTLAWGVLFPAAILLFNCYYDQLLTWTWYTANARAHYRFTSEPMRGWHTYIEAGKGVDAAADYISANVPKSESLWILPNATMIYGLTGRESLRGQPFIYHTGVFPPPGKSRESASSRLLNDPPAWILIHRDLKLNLCYPNDILNYLGVTEMVGTEYESIWRDSGFELLKHRAIRRTTTSPG